MQFFLFKCKRWWQLLYFLSEAFVGITWYSMGSPYTVNILSFQSLFLTPKSVNVHFSVRIFSWQVRVSPMLPTSHYLSLFVAQLISQQVVCPHVRCGCEGWVWFHPVHQMSAVHLKASDGSHTLGPASLPWPKVWLVPPFPVTICWFLGNHTSFFFTGKVSSSHLLTRFRY